jgi:hypothetical protein
MDTDRGDADVKEQSFNYLHDAPHGTRLALPSVGRMEMDLVTQVATAVSGMAVALGASRLVLQGVLAVTFGRKRS